MMRRKSGGLYSSVVDGIMIHNNSIFLVRINWGKNKGESKREKERKGVNLKKKKRVGERGKYLV